MLRRSRNNISMDLAETRRTLQLTLSHTGSLKKNNTYLMFNADGINTQKQYCHIRPMYGNGVDAQDRAECPPLMACDSLSGAIFLLLIRLRNCFPVARRYHQSPFQIYFLAINRCWRERLLELSPANIVKEIMS
ncbi:hypothetical protein QCA50_020465 [Cerrena zonata]|uniref:Uncharacterized protein n=1 Tax=Cerrena zonata TaxID=2478898 RepID=A0AAW0FBR2_9APHY